MLLAHTRAAAAEYGGGGGGGASRGYRWVECVDCGLSPCEIHTLYTRCMLQAGLGVYTLVGEDTRCVYTIIYILQGGLGGYALVG